MVPEATRGLDRFTDRFADLGPRVELVGSKGAGAAACRAVHGGRKCVAMGAGADFGFNGGFECNRDRGSEA